jgi:hypothetical protein
MPLIVRVTGAAHQTGTTCASHRRIDASASMLDDVGIAQNILLDIDNRA